MQQPVDLFQKLRSMFPHEGLDFILRATSYVCENNKDLGNFVTDMLNGSQSLRDNVIVYGPDPSVEEYLASVRAYLEEVLPDAHDQDLSDIIEEHAGKEELHDIISCLVASGTYRKNTPSMFDVEEYLKLIPDPEGSFNHPNFILNDAMKADGVEYLAKIFNDLQKHQIVSLIESTGSLYVAYRQLRSLKPDFEFPSVRTPQPKTYSKPDYDQVFEKLFIEHEDQIRSCIQKQSAKKSDRFTRLKRAGALTLCLICLSEVDPSDLLVMCVNEHCACGPCIKTYTESLFSQGTWLFHCITCDESIPDHVLIEANWDSSRYGKLLENRAGKSGSFPCPSCNYPLHGSGDRVICTSCRVKFCGKCKNTYHRPSPCQMHTSDICRNVEESMTKELIRYCPKCKLPVIKERDCCNKMNCTCGQAFCYVCRNAISSHDDSYKHFYGQGVEPVAGDLRCPLYSDINKLHVSSVVAKGDATLKKLLKQNPGVKLQYDPLEVKPKTEANDLPPGQF